MQDVEQAVQPPRLYTYSKRLMLIITCLVMLKMCEQYVWLQHLRRLPWALDAEWQAANAFASPGSNERLMQPSCQLPVSTCGSAAAKG